eukprot:s1055_g16.t1
MSSHAGKALHRALRSHQADLFESFLQKQQLGGRRAMPVTYGLHLARAFLRQAQRAHRSSAIIFLDLKEAFFRIFRPLCFGGRVTDTDLARLMHRLNMPSDALQALHQMLTGPTALAQPGMDSQQRQYLWAIHQQTHFWMAHQTDLVQTSQGPRPGDPFADVIFSYICCVPQTSGSFHG